MQIKNKLHSIRYVVGTIINYAFILVMFPTSEIVVMSVFLFLVLINQYLLGTVVADLTGVDKNNGFIPTSVCAALKLLVLMGAFYYALGNTVGKELFLVGIYIFQLIILVLSTKRIVKKN